MAKALKCDICGGFFEYKPGEKNRIDCHHRNFITGQCSEKVSFDCCPVCFGEITKIFEERFKLKEGEKNNG